MSSRRFPLAPVLSVRRVQERIAAAQSAVAERAALTALENACHLDDLASHAPSPARVTAADLLAGHTLGLARAVDAVRGRQQWTDAVAVREHERLQWSATATRVKALERLEERHVLRVKATEQHAEEMVVDDIVAARHAVRSAPRTGGPR